LGAELRIKAVWGRKGEDGHVENVGGSRCVNKEMIEIEAVWVRK
jgi:hypothetical protein